MKDRNPYNLLPRMGAEAAQILRVYEPGVETTKAIPLPRGLRCLALRHDSRPGPTDE